MDVNTERFARQFCFFMRKCDQTAAVIRIKAECLRPFFESADVEVMGVLF